MNYRTLGRTSIRVSEVGMGCEGFDGKTAAECKAMIDAAMGCGMNFIEIFMSDPVVRENIGAALASYPRESFVVQGHIGAVWSDGQYKRSRDLAECKAAFGDFLRLMRLDYADIGCLHYCDVPDDWEIVRETLLPYAKELKAAGKIRAIGLSTHNVDIAAKAALTGEVDVILFSINPAYDMFSSVENVDTLFDAASYNRTYRGVSPERAALYELCQNTGVALIVMKAFAGGFMFNPATPFGRYMTPVKCIHYCLTRPAVASVMVGARSVEEFIASAAYSDASDEERDYGDILAKIPSASFDGRCMYCGHCAPCPVNINVAAVNKFLDLSLAQGFVPDTVREHYGALDAHAGDCVECGSCESNCPFSVEIIAKMKEAAEMFGK